MSKQRCMWKERPILMSAPMVRAILAGTKTQTRRAVRCPGAGDAAEWLHLAGGLWAFGVEADMGRVALGSRAKCPYGAVGDRLWVKETWAAFTGGLTENGEQWEEFTGKIADMRDVSGGPYVHDNGVVFASDGKSSPGRWRPSIFMPRWASRIALEVTDVRVERMQSISDADIAAEGVTPEAATALFCEKRPVGVSLALTGGEMSLREAWRVGWSSINGPESWDANPWCWCLSFRRVE